MSKIITFTIPGKPGAKGRPRFRSIGKFVQTYTPKDTVNYENLVKLYYMEAAANAGIDMNTIPKGMFEIYITAWFDIPVSKPMAWKKLVLQGAIRPTSKPDWDNIGKVVCDSLNGIAWKDDSYIVDGRVKKGFSEVPRVEVQIINITDPRDKWTGKENNVRNGLCR